MWMFLESDTQCWNLTDGCHNAPRWHTRARPLLDIFIDAQQNVFGGNNFDRCPDDWVREVAKRVKKLSTLGFGDKRTWLSCGHITPKWAWTINQRSVLQLHRFAWEAHEVQCHFLERLPWFRNRGWAQQLCHELSTEIVRKWRFWSLPAKNRISEMNWQMYSNRLITPSRFNAKERQWYKSQRFKVSEHGKLLAV